jgi:aryl-alcohol dehydrogenase-like predicted oxidoreductase
MEMRALGKNGPKVSQVGLGCMGMSAVYGPADEKESVATIHAAMEAGITLLDTGDFYGMGHNETVLREALKGGKREKAFIQVKYGAQRGPDGAFIGFDASPAATKTALTYSLQRLGTDYVDLYQPARLDPKTPIEETIGAIADLVKAGYVRHIGLSEVGVDTIRRAHKVHPIAELQIEYAIVTRGIEAEILPVTRELGISITAYGILSRGLIGGVGKQPLDAKDWRSHSPRFQGENLQANLKLVAALEKLAQEKNVTAAQLAIAWVVAQGTDIIPLIGTKSRKRLAESLGALDIKLSPQDLAAIEAAVPADSIAGTRYEARQMAMLDSERRSAR